MQGTSSYQVNRVTVYRGEIRSQIRGSTCQKIRKHLMDLMLIKRNIVMEISPSSGYLEEIKLLFFFFSLFIFLIHKGYILSGKVH